MWAKGSKNDVELTISDIDSKIYFYRSYFPLMWAKGSLFLVAPFDLKKGK
jgi:hypothetical protein